MVVFNVKKEFRDVVLTSRMNSFDRIYVRYRILQVNNASRLMKCHIQISDLVAYEICDQILGTRNALANTIILCYICTFVVRLLRYFGFCFCIYHSNVFILLFITFDDTAYKNWYTYLAGFKIIQVHNRILTHSVYYVNNRYLSS